MRFGQLPTKEILAANQARDDLKSVLKGVLPDEAVDAAVNAVERLIDAKIATPRY